MEEIMASNHHQQDIRSLIQAASEDDVNKLNRLIHESPRLVSHFPWHAYGTTPLHVSASHGHLAFTKSLLRHCPGMATASDSFRRTPLHLASAEGHVEVVKALLGHASPRGDKDQDKDGLDHCGLCLARDKDDRIPLHWAVMRGRVPVIVELERACPKSLNELLEGDTVLHLAVKYYQLPALKDLVGLVRKDGYKGLLTEGNREGNTILHLAVSLEETKPVEYLLSLSEIRDTATETLNKEGFNALEALERRPNPEDLEPMGLKSILGREGVRSRWDQLAPPPKPWYLKPFFLIEKLLATRNKDQPKWISEARGQLIVVATIITTITFQIAVNPPGGVYQVSFTDLNNSETVRRLNETEHCQGGFSHYSKKCQLPGNAVLGYSNPVEFGVLTFFNAGAFTGSLCISFILACGFPLIDPVVLAFFIFAVAVTLESLMVTFLIALDLTNPMLRRTALGWFAMTDSGLDFVTFNLFVGLNIILLARWTLKIFRKKLIGWPSRKQNGTTPHSIRINTRAPRDLVLPQTSSSALPN